ncbi:hypothetical protein J5N97_024734 [Dioscorea zingiberensis]|uniref:Uncharacterized protein n=1 Tax=Dioscorea zingiberensis TaxID=325984 RepID=A0A9D5H962_9LILI|nr:hypothetical protein J5N97_024734 [Dioscorea zingiberensis]
MMSALDTWTRDASKERKFLTEKRFLFSVGNHFDSEGNFYVETRRCTPDEKRIPCHLFSPALKTNPAEIDRVYGVAAIAGFTFLLCTIILSIALSSAKAVVLDTDGEELKPNIEYYILPSATVYAGGLTIGNRNSSCAKNVAQAKSPVDNGLPVTFSTVNPNATTVPLSGDTNIIFSGATTCNLSTVWTLTTDETTGKRFVTIGGVIGNPGRETLSNWFNIHEHMNGLYKLVYCPTVCNTCRPACGHLGIIKEDDEERWLAVTEEPFTCQFKKA